MTKRRNWQEFKAVLDENGITTLYHFTDRTNLESIINSGGLYSWRDCQKNNIQVSKPGGSRTSHDIDKHLNLDQYVRLSFALQHPMMYVAKKEGRIDDPIVLEIDPSIVYEESCLFADMNATKAESICADTLYFFKRIHFDTVKEDNHFNLEEEEVPYYQAEVLVEHFIPLRYITNIWDFGIPIPHRFLSKIDAFSKRITSDNPTAFVFLIDQSMSMKRFITLNGVEMTIAEAAADLVNKHIKDLLHRCISNNKIEHNYDIAVIGYGREAYSAWKGELDGKGFVSPEEIGRSSISIEDVGTLASSQCAIKDYWIESRHDGRSSDYRIAYTKAESLIKEWIENRGEKAYYPPSIIHITDGLSLNMEHSSYDYDYFSRQYYDLMDKAKNDNLLILNVILAPECDQAIIYPRDKGEFDERYELLFDLSSNLNPQYNNEIAQIREDYDSELPYKAMVINSDISVYINLLDIVTTNK